MVFSDGRITYGDGFREQLWWRIWANAYSLDAIVRLSSIVRTYAPSDAALPARFLPLVCGDTYSLTNRVHFTTNQAKPVGQVSLRRFNLSESVDRSD